MIKIPESFLPEKIDPATLPEWLSWSLGFFSEPVLQNPHVDLTLQLDVTNAYSFYLNQPKLGVEQVSFFSFMVWHLAQTLARHPSFNMRLVAGDWYYLHNPPIYIPVGVGGDQRFRELALENVYQQDYPTFVKYYRQKLEQARSGKCVQNAGANIFAIAHQMGNLPNLRFTGLTTHWRADQMIGQSNFYFGQRYEEGERMMIPLSVKMHHSCTDPFVLNELIADLNSRFEPAMQ